MKEKECHGNNEDLSSFFLLCLQHEFTDNEWEIKTRKHSKCPVLILRWTIYASMETTCLSILMIRWITNQVINRSSDKISNDKSGDSLSCLQSLFPSIISSFFSDKTKRQVVIACQVIEIPSLSFVVFSLFLAKKRNISPESLKQIVWKTHVYPDSSLRLSFQLLFSFVCFRLR